MATFTIDSENNIVAHTGSPAGRTNRNHFRRQRSWRKSLRAGLYPAFVETWSSFAGVARFDDLNR
jgi:hypothetical protein